jgi:hypothetical protein
MRHLQDECNFKVMNLEDKLRERNSEIDLLNVQIRTSNETVNFQKDQDIINLAQNLENYKSQLAKALG